MDTITDIKFDCAHCGQRMVVAAEAAGLTTECPSCRTGITIPKLAALHDRDYEGAAGRRRGAAGSNGGPKATRKIARADFADPELASLRKELIEARVQISRLEGEIAAARSGAGDAASVAEQAKAEAEKLQKERRKLRDDLVQLKKELAAKETELADVLGARKVADARAAALAGELNRTEGALTLEQEEVIRLRAEVETLASERSTLLPRLETAESDATASTQALRELEIEAQNLRTNLADTQAARTTALREIQALEQRAASLDSELVTSRATATQAETRLRSVTEDLAATGKRLGEVDESAKALTTSVQELEKERDALRKSLSEDTAGRDLIETREHLRVTEKERGRLATLSEKLTAELEAAGLLQRNLEEQLKSLLRELDEARRCAEAASEIRLRQDNEVLRGIIARQNSELEQRHLTIVRLKRARLGVRLAYAAFGLGLVLVAWWAMKTVPGWQLGKLF